jgi:UDP-glucose 4-epimerase
MKAIVFGGSGFLGSHVVDELINRGHDVTIFDSKPSKYHPKTIVGDVLDYDSVVNSVKGQDIVYNFIANADIDTINPIDTLTTNVIGNAYILNAACNNGVKRFVFASSIYVFSNKGSFYSSSKRCCEDIIKDYWEEYKLPYTIIRYGSLYGPRANNFNWIHRAIKQALTENKITRKGDGEELREYIYVKDAASLSVDILSPEFENNCVNITGNQQLKIKDLHTMIKEIINKDITLEYLSADDWKSHYEITPYVFKPQVAKKLTSNQYHDLGQGLLECIAEAING